MTRRSWNGIRHFTIPERLGELVQERPEAIFARFDSWSATYAQITARGIDLAGRMHALGVETGDRVATLAPNRYELVELLIGTAELGAVAVPLNPYLKGAFLQHQLQDSAASVVVTDGPGWDAIRPLLGELPLLRAVVLLDPMPASANGVVVVTYRDLPVGPAPVVELTPADPMAIIYTSGTTGEPKGCVLSHGYYARVGETLAELMRLTAADVYLTPLPLFHASSQLCALMPSLSAGIPVVFTSEFSASRFFQVATETGATVANGVGAMATMLLATPPGPHDRTHALRLFNVSPLDSALHDQFQQRFGVDPWTESYGQTECVFQAFLNPDRRERTSNGRPLRDLELAVLDDDCQPLSVGEVGEICLRPRHRFAMFDGYWRRPDATLNAFRGLWYHTGDYGMFLESGNIRFVDRKKDALRVRGENVSSLELEAALARFPDVLEVAVHGMPSNMGDDEIKACLVVAHGATVDPAKFFEWMTDNVPYFAVPRYVEVVAELPKNQIGRVQKFVLRERGKTADTWDYRDLGMVIARDRRR